MEPLLPPLPLPTRQWPVRDYSRVPPMTLFFGNRGVRASIPALRNAHNSPRALFLSVSCRVIDFGMERARDTDREGTARTCVGPRYFMACRPVLQQQLRPVGHSRRLIRAGSA